MAGGGEHGRGAGLWRSGARVREVFAGYGVDADGGDDCQKHLCVAGAMSRQYGRAIHRLDEIPDEELATLAARGHEYAVADRRLGAEPGLEDDQAVVRQLGCGGLGLLALRLHDCRRPGRRGGVRESARPRLSSWDSAGQRHGSEPHGDRFAVGGGASGLVHLAPGVALPGVQLQWSGSLAGRARGDQDRGPLF